MTQNQPNKASGGDQIRVTIGHNAHNVAGGKNIVQTNLGRTSLDPSTDETRFSFFQVVVSSSLAIILSILTNIIAAYLQEYYQILQNKNRFVLVVCVFLITLLLSFGWSSYTNRVDNKNQD